MGEDNDTNSSSDNQTLVSLNVYDLTPINNYTSWVGFGIFHSGIEVHGMEYGFGAHDYPVSGVFEVEPKSCPGFVFRNSIPLGYLNMPHSEFRRFISSLASEYHGDTYHLLAKNCNHFTDDMAFRLVGTHIPGWVNRLARLGGNVSMENNSIVALVSTFRMLLDYEYADSYHFLFYVYVNAEKTLFSLPFSGTVCGCLLPESLQVTNVQQLREYHPHTNEEGSESVSASSHESSDGEDIDQDQHLLSLSASNADVVLIKETQT